MDVLEVSTDGLDFTGAGADHGRAADLRGDGAARRARHDPFSTLVLFSIVGNIHICVRL